jgi:hypothetical protein
MFSKPQPGAPGTIGTTAGTANPSNPVGSNQIKTSTGHSPSTQAALGKIESAVGSLVSSDSLKAKGDAKVAEADAIRAQNAELKYAATLETNAQLARDRENVHAARGNVHESTRTAIGTHGPGAYPGTGGAAPANQPLR